MYINLCLYSPRHKTIEQSKLIRLSCMRLTAVYWIRDKVVLESQNYARVALFGRRKHDKLIRCKYNENDTFPGPTGGFWKLHVRNDKFHFLLPRNLDGNVDGVDRRGSHAPKRFPCARRSFRPKTPCRAKSIWTSPFLALRWPVTCNPVETSDRSDAVLI